MRQCKLNDIATVTMGQSPKSECYNSNGDGLPFLQGNRTFGLKYPVFDTYTTVSTKIANPNDVIMSVRAPVGDLNITPVKMCLGRGVCSLRMNNGNQEYLYYLMKYNILQLVGKESGTVFGSVNRNDILGLDVVIHDENTQDKVAGFLSYLDKKIEQNFTINDNLQQQLKLIYDYWFTQFDFPDENGKPYRSSGGKMVWNEQIRKEMPADWSVLRVSDLLNVVTGKEDANHSSPFGQYNFYTCSNSVMKCDDFAFDGEAVLIAGNGDFNVKHYTGKFNAYQRTYVLIPKETQYKAPIYLVAKNMIDSFKSNSNGSIVKFITKGDIENIRIYKPSNTNLYKPLNDILKKIEANEQENKMLSQVRDWLLPMLMNGQAMVTD